MFALSWLITKIITAIVPSKNTEASITVCAYGLAAAAAAAATRLSV